MKKTALIIAGILMLCPTLLKAQQPEDGVTTRPCRWIAAARYSSHSTKT